MYLEAFPYRNWLSIWKKLKNTLGDIQFPFDRRIRNTDTLSSFLERFPDEQHVSVSSQSASVSTHSTLPNLLNVSAQYAEQDSVSSDDGSSIRARTPSSYR